LLLKNISDITFAFVDFETTGLDPYSGDRICEVGILKTKRGEVIDRYETLVNPGVDIPPGATAVNGITDDMVRDAPFFIDVAGGILDFIKDTVLVAHNASFDLGFLAFELKNLGFEFPKNPVVDTLIIARRHYSFSSNSLGKVARYLNILPRGQHRAIVDTMVTKEILEYFIGNLRMRGFEIETLKDLLKLQGGEITFPEPRGVVFPPVIEDALRNKGKLRIKYDSPYKGTTTRVIEPVEVTLSGNYVYILAFCHFRKEMVKFRLDRILEVKKFG